MDQGQTKIHQLKGAYGKFSLIEKVTFALSVSIYDTFAVEICWPGSEHWPL